MAPAELLGKIPSAVEDLILTLLAKDPARRYPAADSVAADLAAIQLGRPISIRRQGPVRRHLRAALAVAVLVILVLGAALALWLRGATPGPVRTRLAASSVSHVLWVDDNPENNAEIAGQLRHRGVEVMTALSTADALRRYDPAARPLVISEVGRYEGADNAYAGRAGLDLLSTLRARHGEVRFVFCTSTRAATKYRAEAWRWARSICSTIGAGFWV